MSKACDGASVGVLVLDHLGRVLIGTRADRAGKAPIAGHVFDEHDSYEAAAVAEVAEEAGMDVVPGSLRFVVGGHRWIPCKRGNGPNGVGHEWRVYTARATGEPYSADGKMLDLHWADRGELDDLICRTVAWARGAIASPEWAERPGMEPVWCRWLIAAGLASIARDDLLRIDMAAEFTPNR